MGREDVVMEEVSDDETEYAIHQARPHRSGSMSSPPPPPPDFNPPADTPTPPVEAVTPPNASASSSFTNLTGYGSSSSSSLPYVRSIEQEIQAHDHEVSIAAAAAAAANSLGAVRPSLRALQRVSNENTSASGSNTSTPSASSAVSVTSTSEGGEHLAEAREMLLHSGESSRRDSLSTERPRRGSPEMNVIGPTPPSQPTRLASDDKQEVMREADVEAGPSRPRKSASPVLPDQEGHDLPAEHAWDSVWPAPGSSHRHPYAAELARPHFPTAPVSPYVTPAFSPAIIPTQSIPRKPPSPSIPPFDQPSPNRNHVSQPQSIGHRPSPRDLRATPSPVLEGIDDALLRRRRSITSSSPLLAHPPSTSAPVSISKHQRSFSASSPTYNNRSFNKDSLDRIQPTPPTSPPPSPGQRLLSLNTAKSANSPASSPVLPSHLSSHRRAGSNASSPRGPDQLVDALASQKSSSSSLGVPTSGDKDRVMRPRGRSLSSLRPSPVDLSTDLNLLTNPVARPDSPRPGQSPSGALPPASTSSLPPIALPPPVTKAPVQIGDDGLPQVRSDLSFLSSPLPVNPPPFAPLSRPGTLRRALSDYDATSKTRSTPPLNRSISITAELDKSPKKPIVPPQHSGSLSPRLEADPDLSRARKSPRRSPHALPASMEMPNLPNRMASVILEEDITPLESDAHNPEPPSSHDTPITANGDFGLVNHVGEVNIVDEGDVLPSMDIQMDVTFDDEGLNTLERIFLLSKSEFPFHRAYVARVLGDLLAEVDPCESVEYVLPLLSGFSMDEDETVKEAFASELHRILWYFFSTCKLVEDEEHEDREEEIAGVEYNPASETVTVTADGIDVVPKPSPTEVVAATEVRRRSSSSSEPSTATSAMTASSAPSRAMSIAEGQEVDTPASTVSETPSSSGTVFSPSTYANTYANDDDPEKGWTKDAGPLLDRPPLAVNFFTPLLGSLLLNQNPTISESVRTGVVNILVRLRDPENVPPEVWGSSASSKEIEERRTYFSQNGPHSHDLIAFDKASREMVESELIMGIVVGMGHLSTEMPEGLFGDSMEEGQLAMEVYAGGGGDTGLDFAQTAMGQAELFQEQLIAEATAGRATSMNLIGSLCEHYNPEEVVERGFVDEVLRSGDGDVSVRAEGAVALSCIAKVAPVEHVYRMIPLFELFLGDPEDHVRQSVCLSLPSLCKRIDDPEHRRDFAVKAVTTLAAGIDDVRCAVLEMLGEVIYVFNDDPLGPPPELLRVFCEDIEPDAGIDGDWDVVAAFNFPGVALTLGADRWSELTELYRRLQSRAGDKIMRILAASLHELAKILRPDQVEQDLLPVYQRCLTCNDEIRERLYEHLDVLLSRVGEEQGWRMFLDLAKAWKDGSLGGWRAREQLALHLPSFLETFRETWQGEQVLEVLKDALLDPFAAVRDGVTKGIPHAYVVLGDDSPVAVKFREMLLELGSSPKYRRRLTFVRCLREFIKPPPNQHAFENFFVPSLPSLTTDVVDIRLGLAQSIADLFVVGAYYGSETGNIPKEIRDLADILHHDESRDVRDTLRNVDLTRIHQGRGVPHAVSPTPKPDRALRPGGPTSDRSDLGQTGQAAWRVITPTSSSSPSSQTSPPPLKGSDSDVHAAMQSAHLQLPNERSALSNDMPSPDKRRQYEQSSPAAVDPFAASFSHATPEEERATPQFAE